ncbi:hypothetical protein GCM10027445_64710 [Amycolatopsis endophytica]|uniref:PPE family protein n=1 Tax=Amycolatopsis endophytica TaxID=860233 RepID=A0A853B4C2_9PSEU|nr:hypothetical protein [Amycolatopsis endophytica]NYI89859.1 hypothetical protein [Amycolatopsis endophytica]
MDYTRLPGMVQFALVDVEAHAHLARVADAARMWRRVAAELRELSDSLRHELDHLRLQWTDTTGAGFVRQAEQRKASIDEMLGRVEAHEPWRALDDLARQLLLTRGRVTDTVERATETSQSEAAVYLVELDRYFLAAAEAVLGAVGGHETATVTFQGGPEPGTGSSGSSLPPGSVSMPGLVAVPLTGGVVPRGGVSRPAFDPRGVAGGSLGGRRGTGGKSPAHTAGLGGSAGRGSTGPNLPSRIERAADPVPLTEAQAVPQAPQPPAQPGAAKPASTGAGGGMIPPMMMPPMVPGTARSTLGRRSGGPPATERRTKGPQATPGVPARLRGRSALDNPAAAGYRPVSTSGAKTAPEEPLDREVWDVTDPAPASPLKPETPEPEPRRLRRPRA